MAPETLGGVAHGDHHGLFNPGGNLRDLSPSDAGENFAAAHQRRGGGLPSCIGFATTAAPFSSMSRCTPLQGSAKVHGYRVRLSYLESWYCCCAPSGIANSSCCLSSSSREAVPGDKKPFSMF